MQQPSRRLYVTVDVSYGDIAVNTFQKVSMGNKLWGGGEGGSMALALKEFYSLGQILFSL